MLTRTFISVFSLLCVLVSLGERASALTPVEMEQAVRYYIEEESAYNFATAEITFYLNRAQEALPNLVVDDAFVDLTTIGTFSVALNSLNQSAPTDYMRIKHVFLNDYRCRAWTLDDVWALFPTNSAGQKPKDTNPCYVVFDDNIRIYPLQTTAGTYEVWYYKKPTDLIASNTTQECDLSAELEHYVILLASVYALKKDHEFQKATELMNQLSAEVGALNQKFTGVHGLQKATAPAQ